MSAGYRFVQHTCSTPDSLADAMRLIDHEARKKAFGVEPLERFDHGWTETQRLRERQGQRQTGMTRGGLQSGRGSLQSMKLRRAYRSPAIHLHPLIWASEQVGEDVFTADKYQPLEHARGKEHHVFRAIQLFSFDPTGR